MAACSCLGPLGLDPLAPVKHALVINSIHLDVLISILIFKAITPQKLKMLHTYDLMSKLLTYPVNKRNIVSKMNLVSTRWTTARYMEKRLSSVIHWLFLQSLYLYITLA